MPVIHSSSGDGESSQIITAMGFPPDIWGDVVSKTKRLYATECLNTHCERRLNGAGHLLATYPSLMIFLPLSPRRQLQQALSGTSSLEHRTTLRFAIS